MDKITLSKKSVLALERLAKKVGAKTVTPEGKKKNKTQLINSIIIASRLGKKNPALKTKKAPVKKAPAKKVAPRRAATLRGTATYTDKQYYLDQLVKPDFTDEYPGQVVISAGGKQARISVNKTSLPILVRYFTKLQKTKPGYIAVSK